MKQASPTKTSLAGFSHLWKQRETKTKQTTTKKAQSHENTKETVREVEEQEKRGREDRKE